MQQVRENNSAFLGKESLVEKKKGIHIDLIRTSVSDALSYLQCGPKNAVQVESCMLTPEGHELRSNFDKTTLERDLRATLERYQQETRGQIEWLEQYGIQVEEGYLDISDPETLEKLTEIEKSQKKFLNSVDLIRGLHDAFNGSVKWAALDIRAKNPLPKEAPVKKVVQKITHG